MPHAVHAVSPSQGDSLPSTLIDDFEDQSRNGGNSDRTNLWGGHWAIVSGGSSMEVTYNGPGYAGSPYSVGVTGTMNGNEWVFDHSQGPESPPSGPWSYVILQCPLYSMTTPVNVACHGLKGIQFWMRGDGGLYRAEMPSAGVKDGDKWCWYGVNFTAPAGTWSFHQIPFSEMTRQKGVPPEGLPEHPDGTDVTGIQIYPLKKGPFAFSLTGLSFYGSYVPTCASPNSTVPAPQPSSSRQNYKILFYYSSTSNEKRGMLGAVDILRNAGNQVTVIDVGSATHDPRTEDWRTYDQVWDGRVLDYGGYGCEADPGAADYFGDAWQAKALDYLGHCGRLCLIGECCHFVNRDQGLYGFLQRIQAVKPGFSACSPSAQGSDETQGQAFYPVTGPLGPASIYTGWAGGLPLGFLTGTSFVDVKDNWKFNNGVDRSIACGWTGGQLGGDLQAPACARGQLFMIWDTHPWVWPKWVPAGDAIVPRISQSSRDFTLGMADWLGKGACPCETPTQIHPPISSPKPTASKTPTLAAPSPRGVLPAPAHFFLPRPTITPTFRPTPRRNSQPRVTPTPARLSPVQWPPLDPSLNIVFTEPPANIYLTFADGPGHYQVEVVDDEGNSLEALFDRKIVAESDSWVEWDGLDQNGKLVSPGQYFVILSKDGKALKRISVVRKKPLPK